MRKKKNGWIKRKAHGAGILIKRPIRSLLDTLGFGATKYFGEFGYELISVIPYANWLRLHGKLKNSTSTKDTACLYYFSPHHTEIDKPRNFIPPVFCPISNNHVRDLNTSQWAPPDYKSTYANKRFVWDKPVCIVCNKFITQWEKPPVNFIPLDTLSQIFSILKDNFQIIYNRPRHCDIPGDDSLELPFDDFKLIENNFPEVLTMQTIARNNPDLSFNKLQLMLFANCSRFISVQGGSAVLGSYFGGHNIIYAVEGGELKADSYQRWYNKFSGARITHADNQEALLKEIRTAFLKNPPPEKIEKKIKLFSIYTDEHKILKDMFLKSIRDDWNISIQYLPEKVGEWGSLGFKNLIRKKRAFIIDWIKQNPGALIIWSDIDIQFFGKSSDTITRAIEGKDMLFLAEHWPHKEINSGFIVIRCNNRSLLFFEAVSKTDVENCAYPDQTAINELLKNPELDLIWDILPEQFWAPSHSENPPENIILHHANCTTARTHNGKTISSLALKLEQLKRIQTYVSLNKRSPGIFALRTHLKNLAPKICLPALQNIESRFIALYGRFKKEPPSGDFQ